MLKILIILALFFAIQTVSAFEDPYIKFEDKWGNTGKGDIEFNYPYGIAYDNVLKRLYIADSNNQRIQVLNSKGDFIQKWGSWGSNESEFLYPRWVAFDESSQSIFVTDAWNNNVQKFTGSGDFCLRWGGNGLMYKSEENGKFNFPEGIAANLDGSIVVSDRNNNRVQIFSNNGDFIKTWGSFGTGDNQFNWTEGVTTDKDSNIYVVDSNNNRIVKYDDLGNFILKWGNEGTEDGQFRSPTGIASDKYNNIYVADTGNDRIQKFSQNGDFILKWGSEGAEDGQFRSPTGIATDSLYNIYVSDSGNDRIQKFGAIPPLAEFTADRRSGPAPLIVSFADISLNSPESWSWDFGDGEKSSEQDPVHIYNETGSYNVSLKVHSLNGYNTTKKTGYIDVISRPSETGPAIILPSGYTEYNISFKMPIYAANLTELVGLSFTITSESEDIEIINITTIPNKYGPAITTNITSGVAKVVLTFPRPVTVNYKLELLNLEMRICNKKTTETFLDGISGTWTDMSYNENNLAIIPGKLHIGVKGDFNGNGYVDIGDVARVAHMVIGLTTPSLMADFNENGVVDIGDATKIKYYLLDLTETLQL